MQINLLKDIVGTVAGKSAVGVVDLLYDTKNVNEFLIAKKLGLTINQTRTILYKLADEGLVSFIRKKDSKKGGWYTYFWTLNSGKSLIRFREKLLRDLEGIKSQISSRQLKRFFYCPNCNIEYNEENSLLHDYTCPECGEILQVKDSTQEIADFQKEANKIENILNGLNSEINAIGMKEEKAKNRKLKAEAKKKEKERIKKKKARQRLAKKELRRATGKNKAGKKKPNIAKRNAKKRR